MAWKLDELLYGSQNFETRKTNNRSHRTIDPVVITEIEEKGITSEQLKELHVPVFKYKTQITIHGLFPEIGAGRIGGYKFLIRNQNGSLGVKYNAVDHAKKERIYSYLHHHGYGIDKNSTDWIAYKTGKYQTEKSALAADVEVFKAAKERINNKLFIGTVTVGVYVNPYAAHIAAYTTLERIDKGITD